MTESIENILASVARERSDFRIHYFDVHLSTSTNGAALSGRVLDSGDLQALRDSLGSTQVDTSAIEVLRRPGAPLLSVATNLTSLHREPSFLAEMLNQMVNGAQVEILFEQGRWCFVRQTEGYLGWTYRPSLSADPALDPTHILIAPVEQLRAQPGPNGPILTRVLGGTCVARRADSGAFSEIELAGGMRGWLGKDWLRPLGGLAQRRAQIALDAANMTGTPYLWGGCTANGIDCSGLAQLVHRWVGLTIPRDADMQCAAGRKVEPPFKTGDLLFFGEHGEKNKITHVGISLGGWQIIHSSRSHNGVYRDDVQAVPHLKESFLEAASFLEE